MSLIPISELDEEEEKSVGGGRDAERTIEQRGGGFASAAAPKGQNSPTVRSLPLSGREGESTRSREGAHMDRRMMGQVSKLHSYHLLDEHILWCEIHKKSLSISLNYQLSTQS